MFKPRVYVTRQLFDEAIKILKDAAKVGVYEGVDDAISRELLLENVRGADGLLSLLTERIDEEVMDAGENLKVISNYAVGFNNIDVEAATERGIYVTNTPGILTDTTADYAFALLMALARRIATSEPGSGYMPGGQGCSLAQTSTGRLWASSAWVGSAELW